MARGDRAQPLAVRFVRATVGQGGGARVQEWRSVLTGRAFEVDERDAYAPADALQAGAPGYLTFVGGTAVVTLRPQELPPRPGSRSPGSGLDRPASAGAPARTGWLWWVLVAVLLVVALRLLR